MESGVLYWLMCIQAHENYVLDLDLQFPFEINVVIKLDIENCIHVTSRVSKF